MVRKASGLLALAGAALLAAATPTLAHHAVNAQFDPNAETSMSGTLSKFDNRAPHAYWTFMDDKSGAEWKFESVSPATLRRAGIKLKDDITVGTKYTFYYSPARDKSHTGLMRGIVINGKRLDFLQDYISPPGAAPKS